MFSGDRDGDSPLHAAIRSFQGDTGLVKSLLEEDSSQVNVCNSKGESPLHLALQNKRFSYELIELLLTHGADVRATTAPDGNSALHWLATSDIMRHYTIEALAARAAGNNVDERRLLQTGENELAERGHLNVAVAKILLRHGGDVNARNLEGDSPLHSAIRSFEGDTRLVKYLLDLDHDVHDVVQQIINARNLKDESPLFLAIQNGRCSGELIELLLERGADVRATTARDGNTALHWLAMVDPVGLMLLPYDRYFDLRIREIIKILLKHGGDVNARNWKGETPLHLIAPQIEPGYISTYGIQMCAAFLRHGSDVNATDFKGDTPFHLFLRGRTASFLNNFNDFLEKTRDINLVDSDGETPLHLVIRNKSIVKLCIVKELLDHGADVSKKDAKGMNAYQAYCQFLEKENRRLDPMLQILLQAKAQEHMDSSLHVACLFHRVDIVHSLLRMGADANARDKFGSLPISYAFVGVASGDAVDKCSTLRLLLDYGADINQRCTYCDIGAECNGSTFLNNMVQRWGVDQDRQAKFVKIVVEHVAKLKALQEKQIEKGFDVEVLSDANENGLYMFLDFSRPQGKAIEEFNDWLSRCSEEVKAMSENEVGAESSRQLSFLDLLLASAEKTTTYAKNKELVKAFHARKVMFPMYQGMLDAKLARDLERQKLLDSAAAAMSDALRFADPSDEFFERTLSYCSNNDLVHVVEAMELN